MEFAEDKKNTETGRNQGFSDWIRQQVAAEPYFFQRIELEPGFTTPGWSDPLTEKLPYFGLPDDLSGQRVLDIGCAEGFFSFEAERRGAAEVVSIDRFPDSIRRFNICKAALNSQIQPYLCSVYDLSKKNFGTFDLVLFYGVLYHLRHPLLALEQIQEVCTGTMLLQSAVQADPELQEKSFAEFHPHGMESGPEGQYKDPTIFWMPSCACVEAMVSAAEFVDIERLATAPVGIVIRAKSPTIQPGVPPDQRKAPWS